MLELRPHRTEAASSPGRLLHILTHTCFTHSLKYDIFLYSKLDIHEMWLYSFMGFWTKSGLEWIEWVVPLWLSKLLRTTALENNLTHIYAHFHASTWQRDKDEGSLLPSQWKYKSHFQRINGGAAALLFYSHINIPWDPFKSLIGNDKSIELDRSWRDIEIMSLSSRCDEVSFQFDFF